MKLLLIDNRVRSIEYITRSLEEGVEFFIFDYETETQEGLKSKISKEYDSIGIVQEQDNIPSYTLAKPMGDYDLNDYSTWTTYKELVEWASNLGTKTWDLIECNIDETWQPVISSLQSEFNITIRSSSKQLGNTNLGDNWVFDDGTSLIGIYFTTAINEYPHTLGGNFVYTQYYIDISGDVWGQGANNNGQLGQGNFNFYSGFIKILGLTKKCVQVESTNSGTIFVLIDGTCYSCGYNNNYCLGLTTLNINYTSTTSISITGVKSVTCGWSHTFFLKTNGDVFLAGSNGWGASTTGDGTAYAIQKKLSNVLLISAFRDQTLLVYADRPNIIYFYGATVTSSSWSYNIANANYTPISLPTVNNVNVKSIECGGPSIYYVDVNNNLYAYGYNHLGQLGQGNTTNLTSWKQIKGTSSTNTDLVNKVQIVKSAYLTLQIMTLDGSYYICGAYPHRISSFFTAYNLIDTTPTDSINYTTYPVNCLNGSKITGLYSWLIGEFSIGSTYIDVADNTYSYLTNTTVSGTKMIKNNTTGSYIYASSTTNEIIEPQASFSLIDSTGSISVIGTNFYGANVTLTNGYNKVTKAFGSPVIQVTKTSRGNLVLLQNGDVWAFGYNQYGELGTTLSINTSSPVGSGNGVKLTFTGIGTNTIKFITSGLHHSLFVTSDGKTYSCGLNNYGQLGQGNITNLAIPTITSLSNISTCYCGAYNTFFLDTTGKLYTCGYNYNTELGTNFVTPTITESFYLSPVQLTGTFTNVASGDNHSRTIVAGTLYSAGLNTNGQLGLNNTNVLSGFQILTNNPTFAQLFAGENRSASLTSSGSLFTWGKGIGTTPVLTNINVTTVYQVTDIGIIYIKNNKYYVAYATDILAPYAMSPIPNITPYNPYSDPLKVYSNI